VWDGCRFCWGERTGIVLNALGQLSRNYSSTSRHAFQKIKVIENSTAEIFQGIEIKCSDFISESKFLAFETNPILKRVPLGSLWEEFLFPGRKFVPGRNWGGKAVDEKTLSFSYLFIQYI